MLREVVVDLDVAAQSRRNAGVSSRIDGGGESGGRGESTTFGRGLVDLRHARCSRARPDGTHQFDPPERAPKIQGLLSLHEGRRLATKDPHVRIWWLLAEERREETGDSPDFHFQPVTRGVAGGTPVEKGSLPATVMASFTSRGFGVAAMKDTVFGAAFAWTFFRSVGIRPLAKSAGTSKRSASTCCCPCCPCNGP